MAHLAGLLLLLAPWSATLTWGASPCQKGEFPCRSGRCVSARLRCDGVDDCGDGSDEAACPGCSAPGWFSCGPPDACLPRERVCDGRRDCRDGRDEAPPRCRSSGPPPPPPSTPPPCTPAEFRCGDGRCIRQSWRCDHAEDCSDGSDEDACDQDECLLDNGGCSHVCVDEPLGFHCACPPDMRLLGDSRCEELDACLQSDGCDQLCLQLNGSFTCSCSRGYQRTSSGGCSATGAEAQLVFSSSEGLRWMSLFELEHGEPGPGPQGPRPGPVGPGPGPVAALASSRSLFWSSRGSVFRVSVDGPEEGPALVLTFEGSASGLAVDWIHRLLYWTSTESGSVHVGLLDGSAQRRLVTGLENPSAVAVDPLQGHIFWAQCGAAPQIVRANRSGGDRVVLVSSALRRPVALSLDVPRQLLFWADRGTRSISRVSLEGRHRKTVVESNGYLDRPLGLAVFEGFVFWTEEATRSLCRASKHDGLQLQVLLSNISSPGGLAVHHPALQPKGPSACGPACVGRCAVTLTPGLEFSCSAADASFPGTLSLIACCWCFWLSAGGKRSSGTSSLSLSRASPSKSPRTPSSRTPSSSSRVQTHVSSRKLCCSRTAWTENEETPTTGRWTDGTDRWTDGTDRRRHHDPAVISWRPLKSQKK
ncbi:low-density lipoprotein receptor-related protein 8-like isoform X2 [Pseudoliparis swirei]|uniref:low-density lipoprotein receptor-related protein 8-like isoform X2 n=1 Tax=Pseudoliparis swirei TaxID=2059687 RepID=UPI0024BD6D3A|nr:low-density lipoprotein receptor-related protein 8-like isoform X2 [Pseudoliparis swirei]